MNALELLKQDHRRVKELFDQTMQAKDLSEKKRFFREIKQDLDLHAHLEETMFYPLFQDRDEFKDIVKDAFEEHQEIRQLLDEATRIQTEEEFDDRVEELNDSVDHHVSDEENKFFPKVLKVFNEQELEELGNRIESAKKAQRGASAA